MIGYFVFEVKDGYKDKRGRHGGVDAWKAPTRFGNKTNRSCD